MLTAAAVGLLLAQIAATAPDGGVAGGEKKLEFVFPGGGVAQIKSLAGEPASLVVPADILRQVAAGADRLQLVEYPMGGLESPPLVSVSGSAEVQTLLEVIETPPVDANSSNHHLCIGHPPIRLYRGKKLVAEFSFDHESMLRPLSKGLWRGGDVSVTRASAEGIALWFKRHGYSDFADNLEAELRAEETRRRFLEVFPDDVQLLFRESDNGLVGFASARREDAPADAGQPEDPVARALPDDAERLRLICRGLGYLETSWDEFSAPERLLLDSASRIAPRKIAGVIDGFAEGSPELRGAARLLFRGPMNGRGLIHKLDAATAQKLGSKAARQVFHDGDSEDARRLFWTLEAYPGEQTLAVLTEQAVRAKDVPDVPCGRYADSEDELSPLSALTLLAERRQVRFEHVLAAARRSWQCPTNSAAARIALASACERLPDETDVKAAAAASAGRMLWRTNELRTRESVDLVFATLLDHRRIEVREAASKWLTRLSKLEFAKEVPLEERAKQLQSWWSGARPGWSEDPRSVARTPRPDAGIPDGCSLLDSPPPEPTPKPAPASPKRAAALAVESLPAARTPADVAAKARFVAGLRLAKGFDRLPVLVRGQFSRDARETKRKAAVKAQREFLAVCDSGADEWCLAADYASGLLFERMGDAHLEFPCPRSMSDSASNAEDCDRLEEFERVYDFRQAGSWYRAAQRKCEPSHLAASPWCGKARDGLERLGTKTERRR
ncbi:MAG: hypothetical protein QM765_08470 [Myxococcales bacterium]